MDIYAKRLDAPERLRRVGGVNLTTGQVNWLARQADAVGYEKAVIEFRKYHALKGRG